jgi:hypothetical protein
MSDAPTRWQELLPYHHDHADKRMRELGREGVTNMPLQVFGMGVISALLALVAVQRGQLAEFRKIRKALEPGRLISIGLGGRTIPKGGTPPMPDLTINPTATDDVQFTTSPTFQGVPGVVAFNWTLDNGHAGDLQVAADQQTAKLVTAAGDFSAHVVVTDPATGITETATVSRIAGVLTAIGLGATLVPKQA